MIAWMKRLTEEHRILFDGREDNPVKENGLGRGRHHLVPTKV